MTQYESGPDTASAALVLEAWHRAVNDADVDTAVGWCADDVAVQGPRGYETESEIPPVDPAV